MPDSNHQVPVGRRLSVSLAIVVVSLRDLSKLASIGLDDCPAFRVCNVDYSADPVVPGRLKLAMQAHNPDFVQTFQQQEFKC